MRWLVAVALIAACGPGHGAEPTLTRPEPQLNLHVIVANAPPGLVASDFVLVDQTTDPPVRYPATDVEIARSGEPLQLLIMVEGDEAWMGNDAYVGDMDPDFAVGAYRSLRLAMDALGGGLPAHVEITVYIYGYSLEVLAGPMPADIVTGAVLGEQEDYGGIAGSAFVSSLHQAGDILRETESIDRQQALLVIGDGMGQDINAGSYLEPLADELRRRRVLVYTLHYATREASAPTGIANMKVLGITAAYTAQSQTSMIESAKTIATSIGQQNAGYHVTFGVYDPPDDYDTLGVEVEGKLANDFSFPGLEE